VKAAAAAQDKMSVVAQLSRLETEADALAEERATALQAESRLLEELAGYESESNSRTEQANHLRILKDRCAEKLDFARAERAEKTAELER
jgi:chromosome segregation protein